jgi:hypothetical protein
MIDYRNLSGERQDIVDWLLNQYEEPDWFIQRIHDGDICAQCFLSAHLCECGEGGVNGFGWTD